MFYTQRKHDSGFPARAVEYCLAQDGVSLDDVDYVASTTSLLEKPSCLLERPMSPAPWSAVVPPAIPLYPQCQPKRACCIRIWSAV